MLVDTHLHLWDRARFTYRWLETEPDLPTRFLPADLAAQGAPDGAVFMEAGRAPEQGLAEAEWVAGLAQAWPALRGIVAFAALEEGDRVAAALERLRALPLVVGVRRLLQDEPDDLLISPVLVAGLRAVAAAGLPFDACVRHAQLPALLALRRSVPEVVMVLDHLGKPPIHAGWGAPEAAAWARAIRGLAAEPNTVVKLSGVAPEAGPGDVLAQARPFVESALAAFGPDRSLVGSDWPVSAAPADAPSYRDWFAFLGDGLGLRGTERDAVLGSTAVRTYRLDVDRARSLQ